MIGASSKPWPFASGKIRLLVSSGTERFTRNFSSILDLGHIVAILRYFYAFTILRFGLADTTTWRMPLALVIASIFDGFICALVSGFFIHRIQKLTGKLLMVVVCAFLSFLRLFGKLGIAMLGILESQEDFLGNRKWLVIATVSVGAASDLFIAGALTRNLRLRRNGQNGVPVVERSIEILDKLILDTLRAGLVNSLLSLSLVIFLLTIPRTLVWVAIFLCQARGFTMSFFATLNNRQSLRPPRSSSGTTLSIQFARTTVSGPSSARLSLPNVYEDKQESRSRAITFRDDTV
ncbi:hypothetical protein BDN71DRAFT_1442919 [Pleurotus eryngii]|uniref:DUF6534 domain-containing protein n=1 Tax=Pleurotus eryngii TaxID=5323 RepID=A0A9P6A4K7_PLEER|nr:hypothetical protein BDN71DRAFT_1442919 [Pleurotus eryngii]